MGYKPISDYGLIGNMHTSALVGADGSIDWYCLPYFDSPSVFGAILDESKGGYFKIAPSLPCNRQQFYYPETNVLITRFLHPDGVGELNDFMPVREAGNSAGGEPCQIFRRLSCVRGSIQCRLECYPAFDYARASHHVEVGERGAVFRSGHVALGLCSPQPLQTVGKGVTSEFTLREGDYLTFILNFTQTGEDPLVNQWDGEQALRHTINYWQSWLSQCTYHGRWRETVYRSALTLKLLTFEPTGAMVAAPTTSLPEEIAFERLVDIAKLRWRIERDYRELKQEIGLGHYEGRGWRGFHHHASMCVAAYGFLICERQTIPPSGPGAAPRFEEPALPQGRRPTGAADPDRTAHPRLNRHSETPSQRRPRQEPASMSLLPTDIPTRPVESASLVTQ